MNLSNSTFSSNTSFYHIHTILKSTNDPISSYSVVQRQLHLMETTSLDRAKAYDVARKEFYALRHQQEIERRVAKEEALWTGAYFGKSMLEIGEQLESDAYEGWRSWAKKEVEILATQKESLYGRIGDDDDDDANGVPPEGSKG